MLHNLFLYVLCLPECPTLQPVFPAPLIVSVLILEKLCEHVDYEHVVALLVGGPPKTPPDVDKLVLANGVFSRVGQPYVLAREHTYEGCEVKVTAEVVGG